MFEMLRKWWNSSDQASENLICPHCGETKFITGPQGGSGTNILCANPGCYHEYIEGAGIIWQELGKASKERLEWPYRIKE